MRIKGVYATEVGDDTPILSRLAQWKIVPKRAVELSFEFQDASASSRSSVNNCTGGLRSEDSNQPESFDKTLLDNLSRKEQRRLLNRIRASEPEKPHLQLRRSEKIEVACDNVIEQVKDYTGESISRGLAARLLKGIETKIAGKWVWSSSAGDLMRPLNSDNQPTKNDAAAVSILARVNRLAELSRIKNGQ